LDPDHESGSRRPETIAESAEWIASRLPPGAKVLDAGCGPGLYAHHLASKGFSVVGLDISRLSLQFARVRAEEAGLDIDYRRMDLRDLDMEEQFDAILLIYGTLGMFRDKERDMILGSLHRALRPGGMLIFDVMTLRNRRDHHYENDWYFSPGGFFSPSPHLVLQRSFEYDGGVFLLRQVVLEEGKDIAIYDVWDHTYEPDVMTELLKDSGFVVIEILSDLSGTPYEESTEWLRITCRKSMD